MEQHTCGFSKAIGAPCGEPARHLWGAVWMCCGHFDELMKAIFEIRELVRDREHADFAQGREELAEGGETLRPHVVKPEPEPDPPARDRQPGDP